MKKLLAVILAAISMFSLFSGCSRGGGQANLGEIDHDKQVELTIWVPLEPWTSQATYDKNEPYQIIAEELNLKLTFRHPSIDLTSAREQFNTMMTDKTLPDIIMCGNWYNGGVAEGVRQGLFVDLSDYVEEYAPDYYRRVNANEAVKKEIVNDEKYYAMSDYYIESTVKIKNFNAKGAGLLLRYDGAGNGYLVRLTINDVSVCKLSGGKLTVLDSVEFGIDDKLWTGWRNLLRVSICGNEIKVYLNPYSFDADVKDPSKKNPSSTREPILTVKDDTYASGRVGFYAHGAMAQFDDFIVMDYELAQREVFGRVYQKGES